MSDKQPHRIDQVEPYYAPARHVDNVCGWLYYLLVVLSLGVLFPQEFDKRFYLATKIAFLILTVAIFVLFLVSKLYLIPSAERIRRRQLLADSFGVLLTPELTSQYYNNFFPPSHQRLAANVMENAFFGKEISRLMLPRVRTKTFAYLTIWFTILCFRQSDLDIVLWITQLVFSADILAYWLSLELLRFRHQKVYDDLYQHFLHEHGEKEAIGTASILDAFAYYESAKAAAGVLLDSKLFLSMNEKLSGDWKSVQQKLKFPVSVASGSA